jgi:hypothetical protein
MLTAAKLLSDKLHINGVPILGVSDLGNNLFRIDFAPEATQAEIDEGLAIQAAFDPVGELAAVGAADTQAKTDYTEFQSLISAELVWIDGTAIPNIDTGLGVVDTATLAQLRLIVRGLLENQRRGFLEEKRELKAWRHLLRII